MGRGFKFFGKKGNSSPQARSNTRKPSVTALPSGQAAALATVESGVTYNDAACSAQEVTKIDEFADVLFNPSEPLRVRKKGERVFSVIYPAAAWVEDNREIQYRLPDDRGGAGEQFAKDILRYGVIQQNQQTRTLSEIPNADGKISDANLKDAVQKLALQHGNSHADDYLEPSEHTWDLFFRLHQQVGLYYLGQTNFTLFYSLKGIKLSLEPSQDSGLDSCATQLNTISFGRDGEIIVVEVTLYNSIAMMPSCSMDKKIQRKEDADNARLQSKYISPNKPLYTVTRTVYNANRSVHERVLVEGIHNFPKSLLPQDILFHEACRQKSSPGGTPDVCSAAPYMALVDYMDNPGAAVLVEIEKMKVILSRALYQLEQLSGSRSSGLDIERYRSIISEKLLLLEKAKVNIEKLHGRFTQASERKRNRIRDQIIASRNAVVGSNDELISILCAEIAAAFNEFLALENRQKLSRLILSSPASPQTRAGALYRLLKSHHSSGKHPLVNAGDVARDVISAQFVETSVSNIQAIPAQDTDRVVQQTRPQLREAIEQLNLAPHETVLYKEAVWREEHHHAAADELAVDDSASCAIMITQTGHIVMIPPSVTADDAANEDNAVIGIALMEKGENEKRAIDKVVLRDVKRMLDSLLELSRAPEEDVAESTDVAVLQINASTTGDMLDALIQVLSADDNEEYRRHFELVAGEGLAQELQDKIETYNCEYGFLAASSPRLH